MPARRIGGIARDINGNEQRIFFDSLASLVRCAVDTGGTGEMGEPTVIEIGLDELLGQYADEINDNTAKVVEHSGYLELINAPNYAVCDTPGDVAAKTVDISPFVLDEGDEITVNFIHQNTTPSATLNVSNYGAKTIIYKGEPLPGGLLHGVQKFVYDGEYWNIVGDFDTNIDTTYDVMGVTEALGGSEIAPRSVNALNLSQAVTLISTNIVNAHLSGSYDIAGLQAQLNDLMFQLVSQGIIGGGGLDTVVTIDSESDVVLVSGMYADGKVFI